MAVEGVFGSHQSANTRVDSSYAVEKANEANGVDQVEEDKSAAADLNFETFLKLLTVQLQYQDPMEPMKDTEWTTQLAQYSTLEAQLEGNELLERLAAAENLSQESLAISYIGKEALVPGSITATNGEAQVSINYSQNDTSYKTQIEIREIIQTQNEDGSVSETIGDVVRTMEGTTYEGRNEVVWNSLDDNGDPVEPGYYSFSVSAVTADGTGVSTKEYTYGRVSAVETSVDGDDMILTMSDGRVSVLDDVLLVRESYQGSSSGGGSSSGDDASGEETTDGSASEGNNEEEAVEEAA